MQHNLPLPLVDGCLLFDNSALEKLQNCPREYEFNVLRRRELASKRAGLNFGGALHKALAWRYETYGFGSVMDAAPGIDLLRKHFEDSPEPVGDYRTFELSTSFFDAYNKFYPKEPFRILSLPDGKPFVEKSFMSPIGFVQNGLVERTVIDNKENVWNPLNIYIQWANDLKKKGAVPIFYCGRIDLGIVDNEGEWVFDHKSAFQFGENFKNEMLITPQMRGYAWEFRNAFGRLPAGYIINGFRVRRPTKEAEYDESKRFTRDDFLRIPQHLYARDIDEWQSNTLALIDEFLWHWRRGEFLARKKNCVSKYGACQFYDVCNLPEENRMGYLESGVFEDSEWTPLNKP